MGRAGDRISELPDIIRLHILSLLPRKYAIRASVLSSRWRGLWRYRWPYNTNLDFGEDFAKGLTPKEFVSSVNQVLHLRGNKKIEIFQLSFYPGSEYESDVVRWMEYLVMNGIEEISMDFSQGYINYFTGRLASGRRAFKLPDCLFDCESLTVLSLKYCNIGITSDFRQLRFLETLCLQCVNITDKMVTDFISSCPFLEKLDLRRCFKLRCITVSGDNLRLKTLVIVDCWQANQIEIFAPNLRSFHFNGEFIEEYLFRNVSSLVVATMSSAGRDTLLRRTNWAEIVSSISHVKVLKLCSWAVQHISVRKESTPMVLGNLQELHLIMELMTETNLSDIYDFFRRCHCPNLENLFVELPTNSRDPSIKIYLRIEAEEPTDYDFGSLRTIKMKNFKGYRNEMELVKFFLEQASTLESMTLMVLEEDFYKGASGIENHLSYCSISNTMMQLNTIKKASDNVRIAICASLEDQDQSPDKFRCII